MAVPQLTEISLCLPHLPQSLDGLRIVQFSDLHSRKWGPREQVVREIIRQGCDLAVCTGDICWHMGIKSIFFGGTDDRKDSPAIAAQRQARSRALVNAACDVMGRLLDGCRPPLGTWAVQGNHDTDELMAALGQLPMKVLANQTVKIETANSGCFNLCGVCCAQRRAADIPATLVQADPSLFTLCLCHYPEMAEALAAGGVDLILAGHTHGGQICLPNGRPLITHSRTGSKYFRGIERIGQSLIYTTAGVGHSVAPGRLFCPAEVARLTLHQGEPTDTVIEYLPWRQAIAG